MRRRRRAPHVPPGTSSLDPPQLCPLPEPTWWWSGDADLFSSVHRSSGEPAGPVPVRCSSCLLGSLWGKPPSLDELSHPLRAAGSGLPARLPERSPAQRPHPEWGSRILRDNSLILVITGVEAGDGASLGCSGPESTCWPTVGGQRRSVVDTWTSRRLCTGVRRRPPPVPVLSRVDPQAMPSPAVWSSLTGRCCACCMANVQLGPLWRLPRTGGNRADAARDRRPGDQM
jgi:hypothetical protein